ncbi:SNF2 family DNA-dependent ATPase, partial [Mycena filopes]
MEVEVDVHMGDEEEEKVPAPPRGANTTTANGLERDEDELAIAAALAAAGVDALGVPLDEKPHVEVALAADATQKQDDGEADEKVVETQAGELTESQLGRLTHVLERSALYSSILKRQMDEARAAFALKAKTLSASNTNTDSKSKAKSPAKPTRKGGKTGKGRGRAAKRQRVEESEDDDDDGATAPDTAGAGAGETEGDTEPTAAFPQPHLVTGVRMKDYQLEGLQWMLGLDEQGISGILGALRWRCFCFSSFCFVSFPDEMGLGKTLQTIAFCAHLRHERKGTRPFLVVCPLSVLHNWGEEFKRFAPKIPVVLYHGTPAERAEMRRTVMRMPEGNAAAAVASTSASPAPAGRGGRGRGRGAAATTRGRGRGRGGAAPTPAPLIGSKRKRGAVEEDDEDDDEQDDAASDDDADADPDAPPKLTAAQKLEEAHDAHFAAFPVVVTTYDLIIRDRPVLGGIPWGYIVVDEGHRLKNMHCALMREVKRYSSAGRMVLTGTPLHNNLAELWSLLNFILPDIFDDVDAFQEWFSLPRMSALLPSARMGTFISTLHTILKPFLLRRMKVDVLGDSLPPKKSYVLYARLSARQREAYEAVLSGDVRTWVASGMGGPGTGNAAASSGSASVATTPIESEAAGPSGLGKDDGHGEEESKEDVDVGRTMRTRKRRPGKGKGREVDEAEREREEEEERRKAAEAFARRGTAKHVNNMKLQNTVMQLRKVCSHPFLFARPDDDKWALGRAPPTPEVLAAREAELVGASGKMLLLDRLLGELFRRGHKVLLFSQFTTMLDIIEDWAVDMKGWKICRIDGTTPPLERRDQMNVFQGAGDAPDAPRLFLLSTRSGGLGVNLTAADTVIFYDQDWNPQMDAQAQDRAHRIGQTKPVLIFRLVSAHTIEEEIMQRATEKRKLEALVIAKGKFKMPAAHDAHAPGKRTTMAEMAADLLRLEGEQIDVLPATTHAGDADVLSDEDLEALLDRSPEVFVDRGTGWRSSEKKGQAAFAVFEPPADAGGDALAGLM